MATKYVISFRITVITLPVALPLHSVCKKKIHQDLQEIYLNTVPTDYAIQFNYPNFDYLLFEHFSLAMHYVNNHEITIQTLDYLNVLTIPTSSDNRG